MEAIRRVADMALLYIALCLPLSASPPESPLLLDGKRDLGLVGDVILNETIEVTNTSSANVELTAAKSTCGCTTVEFQPCRLLPKEKTRIGYKIYISKGKTGNNTATVLLFGSIEGQRFGQRFDANYTRQAGQHTIRNARIVDPSLLDFGTLDYADFPASRIVTVASASPFEIAEFTNGKNFSFGAPTILRNKRLYLIPVTANRPQNENAELVERIAFKIDDNSYDINVRAATFGALTFYSPSVRIGPMASGGTLERVFPAKKGKSITLKSVEASLPNLSVTWELDPNNPSYVQFRARLAKDQINSRKSFVDTTSNWLRIHYYDDVTKTEKTMEIQMSFF